MFFLKKALDDNNRVFENNSFAENAYFIIDDTLHDADTKQLFYQRLLLSKFFRGRNKYRNQSEVNSICQ